MEKAYQFFLIVAMIVAVLFSLLVFITGKGDAMSGGSGSVRTTFKGKASFEDKISNVTFGLAGVFMFLMLVLDFLGHRVS